MIGIQAAALEAIVAAAEASYPEECCGLLIGRRDRDGSVEIARVEPSENVAPESRRQRFEIDPALRLRIMRNLAGGSDSIVGHYHSHPDRPAKPSHRDVAMAYEPDLVWMIVAVNAGQASETAIFRIDQPRVDRLALIVRAASS